MRGVSEAARELKRGAVLCALMSILIVSLAAATAAIGVSPSSVTKDDLVRGSTITLDISVSGATPESIVTFEPRGEIASWLEVKEEKVFPSTAQIMRVPVTIRVPKDAANGAYSGSLRIALDPASASTGGKTSITLIEGVLVTFNLSVSGEQVLSYTIDGITIPKTEEEEPLEVRFVIKNQGNVQARPKGVEVRVFDRYDESELTRLSSKEEDLPSAEAFSTKEVGAKITHALLPGEYWGHVAIETHTGRVEDKVLFEVLETGSLRREVRLDALRIVGMPQKGNILKIEGILTNKGDLAAQAILRIEIHREGTLLSVLESESVIIDPEEQVSLPIYYTPLEEGTYRVVGVAAFSGRRSNTEEILFKVKGSTSLGDGTSLRSLASTKIALGSIEVHIITMLLVSLLVVIVIRKMIKEKRKRNVRS